MTVQTKRLLEAALKLSNEEREELAESLLDSIPTQTDEEHGAAFEAEIRRRIKDIDEGKEKMIPWAEAKVMIERAANGEEP